MTTRREIGNGDGEEEKVEYEQEQVQEHAKFQTSKNIVSEILVADV